MYRINLISIFIVLFLFSCNNAKIESTRSENEELQKQIDSLKKELNTYKNSPDKLCANIDLFYKNRLKDSLANIKDILTKYHPESPFVDKVSKYIEQILSTEREEKIKAEKERLLAVTKLRKKYDDIQNVTWYYNPYFTHYNDINSSSIYIGKSESSVWLRLKMSYYGDDWIFFENAFLSYDGNTYEIPFDKYREKETDNDTEVWEWIDVSVDNSLLNFMRGMINGKNIKMRLSGKYTKTRNLSSKEISGFKDVLLAYDVLSNDLKK